MDPEDRMTSEQLRAMRGTSWVAIILAVLGFAAAAGFGGMYFLNYTEAKLARKDADNAESKRAKDSSQLNDTISRLQEELTNKRDENDLLSRQVNDEKIRTHEQKNRAETLAKQVKEQKERIDRLESGSDEIIKLRADLAERDVRLSSAEGELQNTKHFLAQTQTNLSNAKTENERLEKELRRVRTELANARQQATSAGADRATKEVLQSQLRDKERQVDDLKDKLRKSEEAFQRKDQEVATLRETLGKAGKEAEELQKAKDELSKRDQEIGRKDAQIQTLAAKAEKFEEEAGTYRRDVESLRNTLAHRGDVSEQVKSLSQELASRDETIKKKDEELAALKETLGKSEETVKQSSDASKAEADTFQKQLSEKTVELTRLEKILEDLQDENKSLVSRLKSEERVGKMVEKGEEFEQIKFNTALWRTSNSMTLRVSDDALPGHKIDLDQELGLEMGKASLLIETVASAKFGFTLDYHELSFAGRSVMPADKNFYGKTFDAGHTVDSEFYIQQIGLGLMTNLGAIHKSDTHRIDLGVLLSGRYLKIKGYMLDRNDGDRATESLDAPVLFPGLKVSALYRDGIFWSVQGRAMSHKYGEFDLRNFVEARLSFGFNIMKSLDIEFGYIYSNTHYRWDDDDTGENFYTDITTEGPYLSVLLTF